MKVLLLVVAIAAVAFAHPGRRGGPPKGPPCEIVFNNNTRISDDCFTANGRFSCQAADLSRFEGRRRPPHLQDVASISFCMPITCDEQNDCSAIIGSVCEEPSRPDDEERQAMEAQMDICIPDRPERPPRPEGRRPEGRRPGGGRPDDEERPARQKRCSISLEARVASMACRVTYDGQTTNRPCGPPGDDNTCLPVSCTVTIDGKPAQLSFCERPPQPPNGGRRGRGPPPSQA